MRVLIGVLLALLFWLQYRLWIGEGSLAEVHNLQREIVAQRQDIAGLRQRNQTLEAEVQDLKHGLEALEERARVELGMIRDGEVFYQVLEAPPEPAR
jgi:cell division protein FtsB